MTFRLENEEGLPWTASTHFNWIVLLVVLTSAIAAYLLAVQPQQQMQEGDSQR